MKKLTLFIFALIFSNYANAFFFFFPLPNLSKPPVLEKTIEALEKSTDTKAIAYASEDKAFGSKQWVFAQASGQMTQEEANSKAMRSCENSLASEKLKLVGGQPLYNFGAKSCELHKFTNVTLNLPRPIEPIAVEKNNDTNPTSKKLKDLQSLFEQKLITQDEYDKKRKEIIDGI